MLNYFILDEKEQAILYRIAPGDISDNIGTLETYQNDSWVKSKDLIKKFANRYATGWVDEDDALEHDEAMEIFYSGSTKLILKAREYAKKQHANQQYGAYPYIVHLVHVNGILSRFGFNLKENEKVFVCAWLHDIIEDTSITEKDLENEFGFMISQIINTLSNKPDDVVGKTQAKIDTFKSISTSQEAISVKLADRIANVEFSKLHGPVDKFKKYTEEQDIFSEILAPHLNDERQKEMLQYLSELLK